MILASGDSSIDANGAGVMSHELSFMVIGDPKPQGSKNAYNMNGRIVLVEAAKGVKEWRNQIKAVAKQAAIDSSFEKIPKDEPVMIELEFGMRRGSSVKRALPTVKPDVDKLERACLDAITQAGSIWHDDAQVCFVSKSKIYSHDEPYLKVKISWLPN